MYPDYCAKSPMSDVTNLYTPQPVPRVLELSPKDKEYELNLSKLAKQYYPKDMQTGFDNT